MKNKGSLTEQNNTSLIVQVFKRNKECTRSELYKKVKRLQEKQYGRFSTDQVIRRDILRLIDAKIINEYLKEKEKVYSMNLLTT